MGWPHTKRQTDVLARMWRAGAPRTAGGMWNGSASPEKSLAGPRKVTHRVSLWSSNCTPGYTQEKWKCESTQTHTSAHGSVVLRAKKLKQPNCQSRDEWTPQEVVHPYQSIMWPGQGWSAGVRYHMHLPEAAWKKPGTDDPTGWPHSTWLYPREMSSTAERYRAALLGDGNVLKSVTVTAAQLRSLHW